MYLLQNNVTDAPNVFPDIEANPENKTAQIFWIVVDCCLFVTIVSGNVLTILAIAMTRRLRNIISNYFILNLAVSDLLVGISLPYHLAFYINTALNRDELICISRFVLLNVACGGSIYNLTVIAVDRYIAIVYPLSYNMYATRKRVLSIIAVSWICTICVYSIPIYWNHFTPSSACEVETVLPRNYIAAVMMPSFFLAMATMFLLYWKIWREAHMCAQRINLSVVSHIAEKNDHKSVQMVLLILGCFSICWLPYFVTVFIQSFNWEWKTIPLWYKATFALALANSGMNPLIYAWKNNNFRQAFQNILRLKSPNAKLNSSFKKYLEKQRELRSKEREIENDHCASGNTNSQGFPSDHQSNRTEENTIENTSL